MTGKDNVKVKDFNFVSFQEWRDSEFKWQDKLGDFYCRIALFADGGWGGPGCIYVAAISTESNPTNKYSNCIYRVESPFISYVTREKELEDWYNCVISDIKRDWKQYILSNYLE